MPDLNLTITALFGVKLAAIIGLVIYNIFAFIVIKQVNLMTQTLEVDLEGVVRGIAIAHFIFSFCVLIYAILI
jgi:hypothetical protein